MIYDCFTFFNELDLLELRLNILKDVVDKFVIVEAPITHRGEPKPLYYAENTNRFAAFADRIIHVVQSDFPEPPPHATIREKAWIIENTQRNAIAEGLFKANPDDTLIISDCDEIPNPDVLKLAIGCNGITRLAMFSSSYYLNYRNFSQPFWLLGAQVLSVKTFRDTTTYARLKFNEFVPEFANYGPTASRIRFAPSTRTLANGGWHFSYLGGTAAIRRKIKAIAHSEFDTEATTSNAFIEERIRKGEDIFCRGDRYFPVPIDSSFPQYLLDNADRYHQLLLTVDAAAFQKTLGARRLARCKGIIRQTAVACVPDFLVPLAVSFRDWLYKRRIAKAH